MESSVQQMTCLENASLSWGICFWSLGSYSDHEYLFGEVFSKMVSSTFGFMLSFPVSCLGLVQFPRHGIICNLVRVLLDPQEMAYNSKILDVKRN
jgi:hypothetical protein